MVVPFDEVVMRPRRPGGSTVNDGFPQESTCLNHSDGTRPFSVKIKRSVS
jgi:hypothetical protein